MSAEFRDRLEERIGPAARCTDDQFDRFERYFALLSKWNERINLTALPLKEFPAPTLDRLFIEPIRAARFIPEGAISWLDLGTGGGSPAIPLKIMRPASRLTMVESRGRKAAFLREAIRTLSLNSASVSESRFEDLVASSTPRLDLDVLTMRAVKIDEGMAEIIGGTLKKGGKLLIFQTTPVGSVQGQAGLRRVESVQISEAPAFVEVFEAV
jgi:16S rRNA (guanine527-N7)-methyltransferase